MVVHLKILSWALIFILRILTLCSEKFTLTCPHVRRVNQRSAESRSFSPGTPVSSHREILNWVG